MALFELLIGASATAVSTQFLTWVREKHGDKIQEKVKTSFGKIDWTTAQGKYRDKIEKDFGTIKLIGSDEKISLDDIFTDVFLLKNSDAYEYHRQLENRQSSSDDDDKRFGGVDFVKNTSKNLYILGKPGAGKTTFLKHIAVQAANNKINKIPVFIYLRDWARQPKVELFDFLVNEFDICGFPEAKYLIEYLLEFGKMIVLLDGLDEVPEAVNTRRNIIDHIKKFTRKYSDNQFLITCRIASIDYSFEDFTYLRMADFTKEQIENYVDNWFKGKSQEKLALFKHGLFNPNNERFLGMASQPLLLSLLCVNFNETMAFSESRIEIYEEAISYLLHKWNAFNDVTRDEMFNLSKERKMNMFSEIAAQNIVKASDYDRFSKRILQDQLTTYLAKVPNAPLKEDIDGEMVIRNIESTNGILIERYKNIYSFGHLSFQEYFTARYVRDQNRINWLLDSTNLTEDKWREVILNTSALLSNADDFFKVFQNSINKIIADEPNLKTFLELANQKALSAKSDRKIRAVRLFYLYLILLEDRYHALDQTIDLSLVRTIAHVVFSFRDFYDFDRALDNALERDLSLDLVNTLDYDFELDPNLAFDYKLFTYKQSLSIFYYRRNWLKNHEDIAQKIELFLANMIEKHFEFEEDSLFRKHGELVGITRNLSARKYTNAIKILDNTLRERGMKSDLKITHAQIRILTTYFEGNHFLLECLKLAVVSDRQAIEDRMFLPF